MSRWLPRRCRYSHNIAACFADSTTHTSILGFCIVFRGFPRFPCRLSKSAMSHPVHLHGWWRKRHLARQYTPKSALTPGANRSLRSRTLSGQAITGRPYSHGERIPLPNHRCEGLCGCVYYHTHVVYQWHRFLQRPGFDTFTPELGVFICQWISSTIDPF